MELPFFMIEFLVRERAGRCQRVAENLSLWGCVSGDAMEGRGACPQLPGRVPASLWPPRWWPRSSLMLAGWLLLLLRSSDGRSPVDMATAPNIMT